MFKLFVELVDYFLVFNEVRGKVLNLLGLFEDVGFEMLLLEKVLLGNIVELIIFGLKLLIK